MPKRGSCCSLALRRCMPTAREHLAFRSVARIRRRTKARVSKNSTAGYATFMLSFMSNNSRRAVSQMATTAGCFNLRSAEMAKKRL